MDTNFKLIKAVLNYVMMKTVKLVVLTEPALNVMISMFFKEVLVVHVMKHQAA